MSIRAALCMATLAVLASCSEDRPNGSPCIKDVDCESGYCRSGTCVQPPVNTQATTATVSASTAASGGVAGTGGTGGSVGGDGGTGGMPGGGQGGSAGGGAGSGG